MMEIARDTLSTREVTPTVLVSMARKVLAVSTDKVPESPSRVLDTGLRAGSKGFPTDRAWLFRALASTSGKIRRGTFHYYCTLL